MDKINEKTNNKLFLSIIVISCLVVFLVGITYSFFNYTRTGSLNNLGTGRISFRSIQNGSLNLTNVFPIKSSEVNASQLDSVTINIEGNTTYTDGEEFEITIVDVENIVNGKRIPINYIATYEATTGNTIGTSSDTYWESRNSKNADIYLLNTTGRVIEGKQVLVGFIKNSEEGISGTLTIKAYIDADRIAISDTASSGDVYEVNNNMTSTEINDCVSYLTNQGYDNYLETGKTLSDFCNGTGTIDGLTFQESLDSHYFLQSELDYLISHNIVKYLGENGTTSNWIDGRTVFTTSEWNSLSTNPISFKIKTESNEGIWVEQETTPAGCFTTSAENNEIIITDYDEVTCGSDVIIPKMIDEKPVTELYGSYAIPDQCDGGAFWSKNITSVQIPDTLKRIGSCAFFNNQLTIIEIPNSVTEISDGAFLHNQLTSVTIGNNVTYVGRNAFSDNQLTSVTIGNGITSIDGHAFARNKLANVTIPNSVTEIGDYAFSDNQLTSVTIGNGITSIGPDAFVKSSSSNPNLTSIRIDKSCDDIKNSLEFGANNYYPWLSYNTPYTGDYSAGTTIYGANDEVCDAY